LPDWRGRHGADLNFRHLIACYRPRPAAEAYLRLRSLPGELLHAAERGDNLGTITAALLRLLERYGAAELDAAIREAIARGVPHPNAVRLALDHRRELRNEAPPVAVILPDHVKARDAHVQPHRLEPYDQLKEQGDE
jgi:hypothetical protein